MANCIAAHCKPGRGGRNADLGQPGLEEAERIGGKCTERLYANPVTNLLGRRWRLSRLDKLLIAGRRSAGSLWAVWAS
jgi:hypothetical protein